MDIMHVFERLLAVYLHLIMLMIVWHLIKFYKEL